MKDGVRIVTRHGRIAWRSSQVPRLCSLHWCNPFPVINFRDRRWRRTRGADERSSATTHEVCDRINSASRAGVVPLIPFLFAVKNENWKINIHFPSFTAAENKKNNNGWSLHFLSSTSKFEWKIKLTFERSLLLLPKQKFGWRCILPKSVRPIHLQCTLDIQSESNLAILYIFSRIMVECTDKIIWLLTQVNYIKQHVVRCQSYRPKRNRLLLG